MVEELKYILSGEYTSGNNVGKVGHDFGFGARCIVMSKK